MPVEGPQYPVNLLLDGRSCLVVGGGAVAARKCEGLLDAGGSVRVVATEVRSEVRALGVPFVERPYRRGDLDGVWLAIAATDSPEVNAAVRADGDAAHIWVNAADDPVSCSFTLPAVVRQGPVTVTVATGGHSPALASWLKAHVADELGPEVAELAGLLSEARASVQAAGRSTEDVDWRPALDWDMLAMIRRGDLTGARERVQACLSSS
ncbi:MAG TPA: bifunctional precorrin-2 dehydrogenase/sirohydrochlorin ferrochelatase [Acidimicrobiales bacterium]|nr:bifunctional precorrin-2 dehydrogenase/sirohydrochlorin ferrochelatase [Acidimicrobiales bacterium]